MHVYYHSIIWMNRNNMKEKIKYLSFLVNQDKVMKKKSLPIIALDITSNNLLIQLNH